MAVAYCLVKQDRRLIGGGDDGIDLSVALALQNFFQSGIEFSADAPSTGFRAQVDRGLGAPLVGGPFKGCAAVGIAENRTFLLPYQP